MPYLAYDIRGIQSFLFAIPKLRSIIGGSALVDRFDRETVPELARQHRRDLIHSGGGRGLFRFERDDEGQAISDQLVAEARRIGVDLRLGTASALLDAAHCAEQLFSYVPDRLDGHPCALSGLYPVDRPDAVHPVVQKRHFDRGDRMDRWFEGVVLEGRDGRSPIRVHPALSDEPVFFREVQADGEAGSEWGEAGFEALGRRGRWAVVCMDGNDIGRQFAKMSAESMTEVDRLDWVRSAGAAIDACGTSAFRKATERVLRTWIGDVGHESVPRCGANVVLPLRPLVLGGDDLALLIHPGYAAEFVSEASRVFSATSRQCASDYRKRSRRSLWPATDDVLTISAGVLYAPTSLPLSSAIPYAESLLALAKAEGRRQHGKAAPSCVDWESVTESLLDRPELRRQREMVFRDLDLGGEEVQLTQRPYTMDAFEELQRSAKILADVPVSVLHRLQDGLRAPAFERQVFVNRLRKNHPELAEELREPLPDDKNGKAGFGKGWRRRPGRGGKESRATHVLDMVGLVLEARRMRQEVRS
jgi:hypothetical protein